MNKRQNIPIKIDLPLGALITTLFNDLDLWLIDISLHSVKKLKTERKRRILEKEMLERIPNIDFLIRSYIYNQMQPIITNTNQLFNQTSSVITSIKQLYEQTQLKTSDISFLSTVRENLQDFLYYLELNQYTLSDYQIDLLYSLCEEKEREVKHHIEELLNAYKKSVEEKEKKEEIVKIFKEKAKIGKALFGEYINKIEKNSTDYQVKNNQKEFQKVSMEDLITEFSNDFKLWVMTGTWPKKSKKI